MIERDTESIILLGGNREVADLTPIDDINAELDLKANSTDTKSSDLIDNDSDFPEITSPVVVPLLTLTDWMNYASGVLFDNAFESIELFTTDSTTPDLAITLTTPDLSGESRVSVDYLWNYTRANRKFHAELWLDGITTGTLLFEHDQEPKDTGNLTPVSFTTKPIELTGVHTLELFIYGSNISDDATIEKATVSIKRWV